MSGLTPEPGQRTVGEACLVPRPDGTDDFALSVGVEVRGGTGAALLAELRRRAAARGRVAVWGDVLLTNRAMLRLLRHRGGVTIEREDDEQVAIIVGTTAAAPGWPTRPRRWPDRLHRSPRRGSPGRLRGTRGGSVALTRTLEIASVEGARSGRRGSPRDLRG